MGQIGHYYDAICFIQCILEHGFVTGFYITLLCTLLSIVHEDFAIVDPYLKGGAEWRHLVGEIICCLKQPCIGLVDLLLVRIRILIHKLCLINGILVGLF